MLAIASRATHALVFSARVQQRLAESLQHASYARVPATFAWKSPKLSMPTSSARSRGHQPPLEASATPRSFEFILVAIDVGGRFGARLPTGSGLAGHRASGGAMLVSGRGCLLSLRGATSPRRPLSRQEATFLQMM